MDYGKYIVLTVAIVGLIGIGVLLFSGVATTDSVGEVYSVSSEVGDQEAILLADIDPFSATFSASNTEIDVGEIVIFTMTPQNGVQPYHDATLYCGDGKTVTMENIATGLKPVYRGQCKYSESGKYEAHATLYDSNTAISSTDPPGEKITTDNILIIVGRPAVTGPYATIQASDTTVEIGEQVMFTVTPENGVQPYHDATLYCGNGKTVTMENIATGLKTVYRAQCVYTAAGEYYSYATLYDSNPSTGRDPVGIKITTSQVLITVSGAPTNNPYATIQVSDTTVREGESIDADLAIYNAQSPYDITVYCGEHDITRDDYSSDTLSVECNYNDNGEYSLYAEIYDANNYHILSNSIDITVSRRSGGGGGGSGGGSSGGSGGTGACFPSWQCGAWGECINNVQKRTCTDIYNCDSTYRKPSETLECVSVNEGGSENTEENNQGIEVTENYNEPQTGKKEFNWIPFIIITVLVILILVYFIIVYPERKKYVAYMNKLMGVVGDARDKGYSDETIKTGLLSQGHKHRHIKKAMKKK